MSPAKTLRKRREQYLNVRIIRLNLVSEVLTKTSVPMVFMDVPYIRHVSILWDHFRALVFLAYWRWIHQ